MSVVVPSTLDPPALSTLAARALVRHPGALGSRGSNYPWDTSWRLSRYVMLTEEVADLLLRECRRLGPPNNFVSLLYEAGRTRRVRLQTVDVRGLPVDAGQIVRLMADRPRELRFDAVVEFTAASLAAFNERCGQLRQLAMVGRMAPTTVFLDASLPAEEREKRLAPDAPPLVACPRLRSFTLVGSAVVGFKPSRAYLDTLLRAFTQLTHLELSNVYSEVDAAFAAHIRATRPLAFLGIYGCNASHRQHLPALRIGGDIGEEQLLNTARAHRHHVLMMPDVLEQLEMLLQMNHGVQRWQEILHLALDAMDEFAFYKEVHIHCGAIIQNVTSSRAWMAVLTEVERQRVLRQLFRSVALHRKSIRVRRFIAIILMNFDVPREMMFSFEGFLDTLGHMLSGVLNERDTFVERVLIFLVNKTCCDVDGQCKVMVGERGLVKMLLKAIHARCQEHNCDEVMRFLWSCLWNVTDETPQNCELFLSNRGMRLFAQCLHEFKTDSGELVRNMMGLVGNIAEVPHLRAQFLTKDTVETFLRLLNYSTADLEISYHAAGVLSNMLSDGVSAWTLAEPSCAEVMSRLERAIRAWNVAAERSINYRSLRPIIRLLRCDVPESQLWAAWALANLTQAMPERYGRMVEDEGGARLLRIVAQSGDDSYLVRLAQQCLDNVQRQQDGAARQPMS
ncbi:protein zer-1 homolog [Pollicipes pollicipes]|uniref:protein zer-1 homolog n=1 Tax=Pollicipes pollicipes TaxID=41117 RepID=UPI00188548E5|nr:protein zer-1 homolog [Pollicipes pollicipes]